MVAGGQVVDNSTLTGKFMLGYQAWHACQGDGAAINKYIHWGHADNARPATNDVLADIWADTSEFGAGELFSTSLVHAVTSNPMTAMPDSHLAVLP